MSPASDTTRTGRRPGPDDDRLARHWIAAVLGVPPQRVALAAVPTATSSALDLVTLDLVNLDPVTPRFALRRFTRSDWLLREPDLAAREASALALLSAATEWPPDGPTSDTPQTRTPELVAVDVFGTQAGHPAVLTTWLPGQPTEDPERLAAGLAAIHGIPKSVWSEVPWQYRPYYMESEVEVPAWTTAPEAWRQIVESVSQDAASAIAAGPVTFIHRDYHPDNVLAASVGRVDQSTVAIVDWVNACSGPPGVDVAHCRLNLVQTSGPEQADAFTAAYAERTGYVHAPIWDAIALVDTLPGPDHVYPPWVLRLPSPPSLPEVRTRLDGHARRVAEALRRSVGSEVPGHPT